MRLLASEPVPCPDPELFSPFYRAMPAASAGSSSPLSAASDASFRIAPRRTLMVEEARPNRSSSARYDWTTALESGPRGVSRYQERKSSSALAYARRECGDRTLSRTRPRRRARGSWAWAISKRQFQLQLQRYVRMLFHPERDQRRRKIVANSG